MTGFFEFYVRAFAVALPRGAVAILTLGATRAQLSASPGATSTMTVPKSHPETEALPETDGDDIRQVPAGGALRSTA